MFILGPDGSGKSSVARRLAGPEALVLSTRELQDALVEQVAARLWSTDVLAAPVLVLDGPVWLRNRPATVSALTGLLCARLDAGRRTLVCQSDRDGSVHLLLDVTPAGSVVVLGLRMPTGRRGRMRFARRMCDRMGLPREAARGTGVLEPWTYARVIDHLRAWQRLPFGE